MYHKDQLLAEERVPNVYQIFDQIAAKVPAGSDKVIFTPWLYGERTPIEDHTVRAAIFNQSLKTTREHIIRAVFEGVAYNSSLLVYRSTQFHFNTSQPKLILSFNCQKPIQVMDNNYPGCVTADKVRFNSGLKYKFVIISKY